MTTQPAKTIEQAYAELVVNAKALQSIIAEQKAIHEGLVDRAVNLRVQLDQYAEALRQQQEMNKTQAEQIAVLTAAAEKSEAAAKAAVEAAKPAESVAEQIPAGGDAPAAV